MFVYFLLGFVSGTLILEPLLINFVYFSNLDLFFDIILTKKNYEKLRRYFEKC